MNTAVDPLKTAMRLFLRSIDARDWGVVEALLHPAVEYEVSGFLPFRGREAVMNYYRNIRPVATGDHTIETMIVDGDSAVCWGRFMGKQHDGEEINVLFADIMQFENRKIRRRRVYYCEPKLL